MPSKKRYEKTKTILAFDAIAELYGHTRIIKTPIGNSINLPDDVLKYEPGRGGYWGANNGGRGAAIATAQKRKNAIEKAKKLIQPYKSELSKRGIVKKIAIETKTPETTVRRYIKYFKENPPHQ